jgi:hypothetical protein
MTASLEIAKYLNYIVLVGFGVFTAVVINAAIFWDILPRHLLHTGFLLG